MAFLQREANAPVVEVDLGGRFDEMGTEAGGIRLDQ